MTAWIPTRFAPAVVSSYLRDPICSCGCLFEIYAGVHTSLGGEAGLLDDPRVQLRISSTTASFGVGSGDEVFVGKKL